MIHYGKKTKQSPQVVLEAAIRFFGPSGIGLEIQERTNEGVRLGGGGGHVQVTATPAEDESRTDVEVQSQEWDYQAKKFLNEIQ